eukprot:gene14902-biopygen5154
MAPGDARRRRADRCAHAWVALPYRCGARRRACGAAQRVAGRARCWRCTRPPGAPLPGLPRGSSAPTCRLHPHRQPRQRPQRGECGGWRAGLCLRPVMRCHSPPTPLSGALLFELRVSTATLACPRVSGHYTNNYSGSGGGFSATVIPSCAGGAGVAGVWAAETERGSRGVGGRVRARTALAPSRLDVYCALCGRVASPVIPAHSQVPAAGARGPRCGRQRRVGARARGDGR